MLIIAIPKSASTSLMKTFAGMHGKTYRQFHLKWETSKEYKYLHNLHNDCKEIDSGYVGAINKLHDSHVFKNHIPPTDNNIKLLKDTKKVILLRNPRDVILSYKRSYEKGIDDYDYFKKHHDFDNLKTEDDWLNKADELGLHVDLYKFLTGWMRPDIGDFLLVTYDELIHNTVFTLKKISEYFGLHTNHKNIKLLRERYTRGEVT